MTIGERLKYWRKENKLTTLNINEKTGIPTGLMSEYENDKKLIGSKNLLSLFEAYNIDLNWLLTGIKNENILDINEKKLIENYRKCDNSYKEKLIDTSDDYTKLSNKEGKSSSLKTG